MFTEGKTYNRRQDIHAKFGGNIQSGISPCANYPYVFLFTSPSGEEHGYQDKWVSNSVYIYSGEGQYGDMDLVRGNKAIKNHKADGRELHLFEKEQTGEYRYLGQFEYLGHEVKSGTDTDEKKRKVILFSLQKL